MKKKKRRTIYIIAVIVGGIIIAGSFFVLGYKTACGHLQSGAEPRNFQTFYAVVSDIQENTVSVKGMEVNDINFRGEFVFSVEKETKIVWRDTDIALENLDVGDKVAITFSGEIMESYPAQIAQVERIQLLDDNL